MVLRNQNVELLLCCCSSDTSTNSQDRSPCNNNLSVSLQRDSCISTWSWMRRGLWKPSFHNQDCFLLKLAAIQFHHRLPWWKKLQAYGQTFPFSSEDLEVREKSQGASCGKGYEQTFSFYFSSLGAKLSSDVTPLAERTYMGDVSWVKVFGLQTLAHKSYKEP